MTKEILADARVPLNNNEQKLVMLKILTAYASFCDENKLQYFLDAGTLIGAIRHKGFIPWDDDVDVCMPRKDFDKFLELMAKQEDRLTPHLILEKPINTMYPFLKLGDNRTILIEHPNRKPEDVFVYIDIFPKDFIRDKNVSAKLLCGVCGLFELMQWFNNYSIYAWSFSKSKIKKIIGAIGRAMVKNPNWGVPCQDWIIKNHNKHIIPAECKYVTTLVRGEYNKLAPTDCFSCYTLCDFEKQSFKVPAGYDTYLKCLYKGDYMQIPSVEKRISHDTIAFWKSEKDKQDFLSENNVY